MVYLGYSECGYLPHLFGSSQSDYTQFALFSGIVSWRIEYSVQSLSGTGMGESTESLTGFNGSSEVAGTLIVL
jgi:hypothetical protein